LDNDEPISIIEKFNQCINQQDLEGLAALMTQDYVFIDSSDDVHEGKDRMIAGWQEFFETYPDYRNHFEHIEARGELVLVAGHSTCSFDPLDGPALWTAKVKAGLVKEWRVYLDSKENRRTLNLPQRT
jgi:ketosteroid isomerase-like protein